MCQCAALGPANNIISVIVIHLVTKFTVLTYMQPANFVTIFGFV